MKYWWELAEELQLPKIAELRHGHLNLTGGELQEFRSEIEALWDHLARTVPKTSPRFSESATNRSDFPSGTASLHH